MRKETLEKILTKKGSQIINIVTSITEFHNYKYIDLIGDCLVVSKTSLPQSKVYIEINVIIAIEILN